MVDFSKLKDEVEIEQLFDLVGIGPTKKLGGGKFRADCPCCDGERALSLTNRVSNKGDTSRYNCFKCRFHGDIINFVEELTDADGPREAALAIQEYLGTSTVRKRRTSNSTRDTEPEESTKGDDRSPQAHLDRIAERLDPDNSKLDVLGLSVETLGYFEAGYNSKGPLAGTLSVPVHGPSGERLAFIGIPLDGGKPMKYPKGFDPSQHVFNWHRLEHGPVEYVISPLDVLIAYDNGETNVVSDLHQPAEDDEKVVSLSNRRRRA